jgi:hypothetical protein
MLLSNAKLVPGQMFQPPAEQSGSQSWSGLDWRGGAEESLGHGSGYRSALVIRRVVKFTQQVGKKFPVSDIHGTCKPVLCPRLHLLMADFPMEVRV